MSLQTLILIMAFAVMVMAWYANSSKRNVILCRYRRVNKTMVARFVKMKSRYVIFDGGKFDIVPSRIVFQWYNQGLVHMLFPQWVATLDFSWNSRFPHDPNNLDINSETPEVRNTINKTEWVESYYKGAKPSTAKNKLGFVQQWLPWIAILLVVMVAFYFNSKMSSLGSALDAVIAKLNSIAK